MSDYAPFPEAELLTVAEYHDSCANAHPERSYVRHVHEERARICRNAIAAHVALRERCLLAELARDHGVTEAAD